MAGMLRTLPFRFSGRTEGAVSTFAQEGVRYDYALGGDPYLSAINNSRIMKRSGAPIRKEQFDNQQIPGEQSLANWWLRSQSTFTGGAGLLYQDPSVDNQYAIRFADSAGVDVWTNGQATLLRSTTLRVGDATTKTHHLLGWSDGTDRYYSAVGNVLQSDDGTTTTAVTWGGTGDIVALAGDGTNYYAADATSIYTGAGTGAGTALWSTGSSDVVLGWVKGRLMAGIDHKVYELVGGTPPTLPTPKMTHLNTAWRWTAFAEGPDSIYAAGFAGASSSIYRFVLDSTGAVPTLADGGVLTAQLPQGETVLSMEVYLGSFVGIGTNRGLRIGQVDSQGNIAFGPLLIENDEGVKAMAAYDRFLFAAASNGIDGKSGLYRVDLGRPLSSGDLAGAGRYAYATDLQAHITGEVCSVVNFGTSNRLVFAVVGHGSYLEDASDLEATGYLETGRIRFNTLEPKIYKFVSVKTPASQAGTLSVSIGDPGGAVTSVITVGEGASLPIENIALTAPGRAAEWVQLKFTLNRSTADSSKGARMDGWQLKAMPGATRQRQFMIPLLLEDMEKDVMGQMVGYAGRARERLDSFEALFQRGDSVSFQELASERSTLVVIDDYSYEQASGPGRLPEQGLGGILWVQLRTIADVL